MKDSMEHDAPLEEQNVCMTCGMCCDGTLFLHACLNPGERGNLPEKIEQRSYTEGEKDFFRLPCLYFEGKCTIYGLRRADVCSGYRCQLLRDMAEGSVVSEEANKIVSQAISMRNTVLGQYRQISGNSEGMTFRGLLIELGKMQKSFTEDKVNTDYDLLQARCNILEALLIKHIRSAIDFEGMVADG